LTRVFVPADDTAPDFRKAAFPMATAGFSFSKTAIDFTPTPAPFGATAPNPQSTEE
jgi:hypothetical protein